MKIVHISLSGPFTEGWDYHENRLPKWHHKLGNDVALIARDTKFHEKEVVACDCETKVMENGVKLYRIHVKPCRINTYATPDKKALFSILSKEKPDIIWVHGVLTKAIVYAAHYKKKYDNNVILVADNHLDNGIYGQDFLRKINLKIIKIFIKKNAPFYQAFYGVTPGRVEFLREKFNIPEEKLYLSIQGGDPDDIDFNNRKAIKQSFRKKYCLSDDDFIFTIGGKLDAKKKIIPLLDKFISSSNPKNKLVIFGSIDNAEKEAFFERINKDKRIIYVGFLNSLQISEVFLSADVGVFPGLHSVLWEKALACGLPCYFCNLHGYEHVFEGGGLTIDDFSEFDFDKVSNLDNFNNIKASAENTRHLYLYDEIARKSISEIMNQLKIN